MCILFHDYEIVETVSMGQLKENIMCERTGFTPSRIEGGYPYLTKKICLKCGNFVDNITPARNKILEELERKRTRQILAERMMLKKLGKEVTIKNE